MKLKAFFPVLVLVTAGAAALPAPASLTIDEAVGAALANNLNITSARVQERIKKNNSDQSWNKFYPSLTVAATALSLNQPENSSKLVAVGAPYHQTYDRVFDYIPKADNLALNASVQEIFSPTSFGLIDQASVDYAKSTVTRKKAEGQIVAAVRKLFFQLLVQKEAIKVIQARLDSGTERLRLAKLAYDLGQGTELNYVYAKSNIEGLVPELQAMKTLNLTALWKFQELLGFEDRDDMVLAGSLEGDLPSEDAGRDWPAAERFDVLEAGLTHQQLTNGLKIRDLMLLPNLILSYTADPTLNDVSSTDRAFDSKNWYQRNGGLSLTLSWSLSSLIPGSEADMAKRELSQQLELANETQKRLVETAQREARIQKLLLRDSFAKFSNLQSAVQDSQRALALVTIAYDSGTGRLLDLQAAEIALQGVKMQLLNERLNLMALIWDYQAKFCQAAG